MGNGFLRKKKICSYAGLVPGRRPISGKGNEFANHERRLETAVGARGSRMECGTK